MAKKTNITLTLTKVEAEWLYDLLAETFDLGASGYIDTVRCSVIADKIDAQLEQI